MARRSDLSIRLNHARCALGLSLTDAGARIGVTRNTVASWESGAAVPNGTTLYAIADAYGVDRADLVPLRDRAARTRRRRQTGAGDAAAA